MSFEDDDTPVQHNKRRPPSRESFAFVQHGVRDLQKARAKFWLVVSIIALPFIGLAGSSVWQASKYPTRDEYEELRNEVVQLRIEQAEIARDVKRIMERP